MSQHHTIGKLSLELQLPARQNALSLQEELSAICKDGLVTALQGILDSWADAGTLLRVERLEIDLGACTAQELVKQLPERVLAYLHGRYPSLQQQVQEPGMERYPVTQGYFDGWLYFLEHGLLPPTSYVQNIAAWETGVLEILATSMPALERCRRVLETQPAAASRMVRQFSRQFIQQWIQAFAGPAQQPLMQIAHLWEQYCYNPGVFPMLGGKLPFTPSLPDRTSFQRSLDEWCIRRIILPSIRPEPAVLLEEIMALSFGHTHLPAYVQALHPLQPLSGADAAPLKTAFSALHNKHAHTSLTGRPAADTATTAATVTEQHTKPTPPVRPGDEQLPPASKPNAIPADQQKSIRPSPEDETATQRQTAAVGDDASDNIATTGHPGKPPEHQPEDIAPGYSYSSGQALPAAEQALLKEKPANADNRTANREKPGTPPEGLSTYINNAGLILLHPYLHILFDAVGLLEKRAFKSPAAQDKAVQLLGYLASGETDIPEYDLVFPKLLCGLLPEDPVDRFVELTEIDKVEANQLLEAVINNWNALGSTSADGLRGNFLMREGKLQWQGDEWRLRVTQQSYDLLLNRLPWGLSVVRLPWMPWTLKTEWV